jgi:hypothetical protein
MLVQNFLVLTATPTPGGILMHSEVVREDEVNEYTSLLLALEVQTATPVYFSVHPGPPDSPALLAESGWAKESSEHQLLDYGLIASGGRAAIQNSLSRRVGFLRTAADLIDLSFGAESLRSPVSVTCAYPREELERDLSILGDRLPLGVEYSVLRRCGESVRLYTFADNETSYEELH